MVLLAFDLTEPVRTCRFGVGQMVTDLGSIHITGIYQIFGTRTGKWFGSFGVYQAELVVPIINDLLILLADSPSQFEGYRN